MDPLRTRAAPLRAHLKHLQEERLAAPEREAGEKVWRDLQRRVSAADEEYTRLQQKLMDSTSGVSAGALSAQIELRDACNASRIALREEATTLRGERMEMRGMDQETTECTRRVQCAGSVGAAATEEAL